MSSLELPSDIADKVVGMLKPRDIPRAVIVLRFVWGESCAFIRGDACTKEELRALKFSEAQIESADLLKRKDFREKDTRDEFVCRALALGFEFRIPEEETQIVATSVMRRAPAGREFA
jgi:hypothetical protein